MSLFEKIKLGLEEAIAYEKHELTDVTVVTLSSNEEESENSSMQNKQNNSK